MPSAYVLGVRHRLEMRWVHARRITAEMIRFEPGIGPTSNS